MYIIEGNERKINYVWEHIKKQHTGNKIAIVGYADSLPQTQLRNKQVIFYTSLSDPAKWLQQAEAFLKQFEEQYDGIIFYVDCPKEEIDHLRQIAKNYRPKLTVTVHSDAPLSITHSPVERLA